MTRRTFVPLVTALACACLLVPLARAGEPVATDHRLGSPSPQTYVVPPLRGLEHPWLFAGNRIFVPPPDVARWIEEDRTAPPPKRIGVVLETDITTDNAGTWTRLEDGWLWTVAVASPGARGLRLRFAPWPFQHGVTLAVYEPDRPESVEAVHHGPPRGDRWILTRTFSTDEVRVEYFVPEEVDGPSGRALRIDAVEYQYGPDPGIEELSCHLDVTCYPEWNVEKFGVMKLLFSRSGFSYVCSGVLVNRVAGDLTPLILTANHCEIDDTNVGTVDLWWRYHTSVCDGPPPTFVPRSYAQVFLGSVYAADTRLIGAGFDYPPDTTFLGMDAGATWADASSATGIHHPEGTYKRISLGSKTGEHVSPSGYHVWNIRYPLNQGLTEEGSSGSPIFDGSHKVRGVLSFHYPSKPPDCSRENDVYYGRLDEAWTPLEPYLDPTDPIFVDVSYSGSEDGTIAKPFNRILEGAYAVIGGSHVYIEAGEYHEWFTISKPMILHAIDGTVTIGTYGTGD